MRRGEGHRHVEVGRARGERSLEDRHHETGVDGVQDRVAAVGGGELGDGRGVARIDARGGEAAVAVPVDDGRRSALVVVGEDDVLEKSRRATIGANADPTPPLPTTRILMAAECSRRLNHRSVPSQESDRRRAWARRLLRPVLQAAPMMHRVP